MTNAKKFRCLVVDDEPIARKIVRQYIEELPVLEFAGECKNAYEALAAISRDETIEILFLDINMPNISGISMVKIMPKQLQIIFTTAYSEFAIESYELNAVDYLLKPFLFERFAKAVFKAIDRLGNFPITPNLSENATPILPIYIKSNGENHPVLVNDILYCEAMKNYTKVVLNNGKEYSPLIALSKFEEEINVLSSNFSRIHRSFIVAKQHIQSIGSSYVMVNKIKIPIGIQYKAHFLEQMGVK
jgi:DNA-binding LytR/AlgR family response regulator